MGSWNPNAPAVVGMEWMPTIEDNVPVTATSRGFTFHVHADAGSNETITTAWFYVGASVAGGTSFVVDVYEDNLPDPQAISTGTVNPAWDGPGDSADGTGDPPNVTVAYHTPLMWAAYTLDNGLQQGLYHVPPDAPVDAEWWRDSVIAADLLKDGNDRTGIYIAQNLTWFRNPGVKAYYKAGSNESTWVGRRIVGLGVDTRIRNLAKDNGQYIHLFPMLNHWQSGENYDYVIDGSIVLQPDPRGSFRWVKSRPAYICPGTMAPWTLYGGNGALQYIAKTSLLTTVNDRFGVRIASPLAVASLNEAGNANGVFGSNLPQVMISEMALRVWWTAEDRVA